MFGTSLTFLEREYSVSKVVENVQRTVITQFYYTKINFVVPMFSKL